MFNGFQFRLPSATVYFLVSFLIIQLSAAAVDAAPLADGAPKFLGNITTRWLSPAEEHFTDYWNQVTPENEGKWGVIERTRNSMDWAALDSSYQFAKRNHLPFKEHNLFWGNQEPPWIGSLSKADQLKEITEWLDLVAERYPDVEYIDVVNEPLTHPASYREALGGEGETGYDWVIKAFEETKKRFPDAKLLINEYHVIDNDGMTEQMQYIATILKLRNLIDGIGLQSHYFSYPVTTPEVVKKNLDVLASTGVPLYSTEFDATGDDSVQLAAFKDFFPIFWEHPCVLGITMWGWVKGYTWETNTWLVDRSGNERPAFTWLKEYIATHKNVSGVTDETPKHSKANHSAADIRIQQGTLTITIPLAGAYSWSLTDLRGKQIIAAGKKEYSAAAVTCRLPRTAAPGTYLFRLLGPKGTASRTVLIND